MQKTHTVRVPLSAKRAMELFTARGERAWVPDWEPTFPAGEPPEGAPEEEGTVFLTDHGGRRTHWVVAARSEGMVRYARVTPGLWSGLVTVRTRPGDGPPSEFEISYDLTALTEEGVRELSAFEAGFEQEIGAWEDLIAAALPRDPQ
jgi:hypothetical protein